MLKERRLWATHANSPCQRLWATGGVATLGVLSQKPGYGSDSVHLLIRTGTLSRPFLPIAECMENITCSASAVNPGRSLWAQLRGCGGPGPTAHPSSQGQKVSELRAHKESIPGAGVRNDLLPQ